MKAAVNIPIVPPPGVEIGCGDERLGRARVSEEEPVPLLLAPCTRADTT